MIEVSEYVRITDINERDRARATVSDDTRSERWRKAELLAAEAALVLLGYFEQDGQPPTGRARPAYVVFDYDEDADIISGGGSDIVRVHNADREVIWERRHTEWEFDADVTDFLTAAMELQPGVFYTVGDDRYGYALPV